MIEVIKNHLPSYCYSKYKFKSVDGIVVHFISAKNILPGDPFNLKAIFGIFKQYSVSANYLIRRDGTIVELVPEGFNGFSLYNRANVKTRHVVGSTYDRA